MAPQKRCDKCRISRPDKKLFHCNKCRTTLCLLCQCRPGGGFESHLQDCTRYPHNYLIGPPSAPRRPRSGKPQGPDPAPEPEPKPVVVSPRAGLSAPQPEPFSNLQARTWLHDRPAEDVFRLLVDSYRLHSHDKFLFSRANKPVGIFAGAPDSSPGFDRFLCRAESSTPPAWPLLPAWWTRASHEECLRMGLRRGQFHDLHAALSQATAVDHYQDASFPTQLRMFAEQVLGRPAESLCVQSCTALLEPLAEMEREDGDTASFEWKEYNKAFAMQGWDGRPARFWHEGLF